VGAHTDCTEETVVHPASETDPLPTGLLEQEAGRMGLALTPAQLALFTRYYHELIEWNERVNLTAIVGWEAVQVQHFLDSLSCLPALPPASRAAPYAIVDVGAGAGFPGLPLKIVLPHARLTLVESVGKKAVFLKHVVQALGLADVDVVALRAEEAGQHPAHRAHYDLAVARAVATLAVLAEYTLPLLQVGGTVVALKGRDVEEEVAAAQRALHALGGRLVGVHRVVLPGLDGPRHLVVLEKVRRTPPQFPRRPGMPQKHPL
jgi:16S rRNA (guanine527-N7)-methyltransferase